MTTFVWVPSYSSPRKVQVQLRRAPFGDGYEQRSGVGINNLARTWDLKFTTTPGVTAQAIISFLEANTNGQSFDWVPPFLNPSASSIKVTCVEFEANPVGYDVYDISATFAQVHGE